MAEVFFVIVRRGLKGDRSLWTVLRGPHCFCVAKWERTCLCGSSYQGIYWVFSYS